MRWRSGLAKKPISPDTPTRQDVFGVHRAALQPIELVWNLQIMEGFEGGGVPGLNLPWFR
jgi:hypothetical protein